MNEKKYHCAKKHKEGKSYRPLRSLLSFSILLLIIFLIISHSQYVCKDKIGHCLREEPLGIGDHAWPLKSESSSETSTNSLVSL